MPSDVCELFLITFLHTHLHNIDWLVKHKVVVSSVGRMIVFVLWTYHLSHYLLLLDVSS